VKNAKFNTISRFPLHSWRAEKAIVVVSIVLDRHCSAICPSWPSRKESLCFMHNSTFLLGV
jgi:hypothetical protein